MKVRTSLVCLVAMAASALSLPGVVKADDSKLWTVSFEEAKETAKKENKDILMEFTGSDWCPPCKALQREVLSKEVFQNKMPEHFILLKLDNPRDKSKQTPEEQAQYKKLSAEYEVSGVPTIILADEQGRPYAKTVGYGGQEAEAYVGNLVSQTSIREKRDEFLAKAEGAEGAEKAKHLDEALKSLDEELATSVYSDVIDQIIEADADDEAGLKSKYQQVRQSAQAKKELAQLQRSFDPQAPEVTLKKIDTLIDEFKLQGDSLQEAMYLKALVLFRMDDKEQSKSTLEAAKKLNPESKIGRQIDQVLASAFDNTPEPPQENE